MARYAVHFEFDPPVETQVAPHHDLHGDTLERAKLEAAILYATADFGTLPAAYRIVQNGWAEVYRYPEIETEAPRGWTNSATSADGRCVGVQRVGKDASDPSAQPPPIMRI